MTTWKNPEKHPPTLYETYWVMREDLKPFKAIRVIDGWLYKGKILDGIIQYTENKPPPPGNTINLETEAENLVKILAEDIDFTKPLTTIIYDFLSDLSANIRADEHDRCHDFYVNYNIEACQNEQHNKTRQAVIDMIGKIYANSDLPTEMINVNAILSKLSIMEKPL
jgi:hypothetical protein